MKPFEKPYSFADETKRFCESYLYSALDEARDADERPEVALFALLQCMQMLITSNAEDKEQAMATFKAAADAYLKDWDIAGQ